MDRYVIGGPNFRLGRVSAASNGAANRIAILEVPISDWDTLKRQVAMLRITSESEDATSTARRHNPS